MVRIQLVLMGMSCLVPSVHKEYNSNMKKLELLLDFDSHLNRKVVVVVVAVEVFVVIVGMIGILVEEEEAVVGSLRIKGLKLAQLVLGFVEAVGT